MGKEDQHTLCTVIVLSVKHRTKTSSLTLQAFLFALQQKHPCWFLIDSTNCVMSSNASNPLLYSVDHKSTYTYPKNMSTPVIFSIPWRIAVIIIIIIIIIIFYIFTIYKFIKIIYKVIYIFVNKLLFLTINKNDSFSSLILLQLISTLFLFLNYLFTFLSILLLFLWKQQLDILQQHLNHINQMTQTALTFGHPSKPGTAETMDAPYEIQAYYCRLIFLRSFF